MSKTRRGVVRAPDGTEIAYRTHGDGEPVVLVHGTGLSQVVWRGLGYVDALADYQVVTLDLRGHGRSGRPPSPSDYTAARFASDVVAVLDALAIPRTHYLGYSLGARIGFTLLDVRPDRLTSFVSLGGTHRSTAGGPAEVFFPDFDEALRRGGMAGFVEGWGRHRGTPLDPQTSLAFRANDPAAMRAILAAIEHEPGVPAARLAHVTTPTLLLAGGRDQARLDASREAARVISNARVVELEGHDHATTLSDRERVLGHVAPFLRAAARASGPAGADARNPRSENLSSP
ncbi:alpha/beta fold hydrolase [Promicromonospora kroppenstedtii]|uniref:alpha/beta fold hydrolase n=1 Tax=Promicromonospora kroppenstedtii TaxID=440482 RepID=UPI0006845CC8|nr:alpha/beta hydrolase [Promicromonospora kroppenstedtii]